MTAPSSPPPKRSPLSALWFELGYAFDRTFKTGKRQAEFEHKYRKHGDYFGYHTKPYELEKYQRTLETALRLRRGRGAALEVGCSVGVFTKMIAHEFDAVTASDISAEALRIVAGNVGSVGHMSYAQSDVISLNLNKQFDVIFAAEVLMYVREADGPRVIEVFEQHLKPDGVIIEVTQADRSPNAKFFHGWDRVLGSHFAVISREGVVDESRPYEIVVYARKVKA
jgi:2-polyprenyl-3-methyl-5-hydroxy-6-metoxy-1,4-benzoquinol methylase